jgi:Fur family zinc uptake transcriptional regulator
VTLQHNACPAFAPHDHARCRASAVAAARRACEGRGLRLTPTRLRALEILAESPRPLGAYELLDRLRAEGLGAQPPAAYRALEFLIREGFAHRVERLNAYVACARPGAPHRPALLICGGCGRVAEAAAPEAALAPAAEAAGFEIAAATLEAEGRCAGCRGVA